MLARARVRDDGVADGEGSVCAAFGIGGPPWPVAALARLESTMPGRRTTPPAGGCASTRCTCASTRTMRACSARTCSPLTAGEAEALVGAPERAPRRRGPAPRGAGTGALVPAPRAGAGARDLAVAG
ncbi:MAG: hypothetical protein U5K43_01305, partial [Halofilum sp. (in: g-proteobacteria)]|nr:hypothetical protein [Halofilum sp. (in: g-proteobacteria)]